MLQRVFAADLRRTGAPGRGAGEGRHRLPVLLRRARRGAVPRPRPRRGADRARARGERAGPGGRGHRRARRTWWPPGARCRCRTTARWPGSTSGRSSPPGCGAGSPRADFDVLHVHEPVTPSLSLLALWAATGPIVATFHTANLRSRAMRRPSRSLRPSLEKITARIAVSEDARRTLVEHLGGDAVVIPNGVCAWRFATRAARPALAGAPATADAGVPRPVRRAAQGPRACCRRAFAGAAAAPPGPRLLVAGPGDAGRRCSGPVPATARPA